MPYVFSRMIDLCIPLRLLDFRLKPLWGGSKWVLPSNMFVCGHHSTVQAASSWLIAPRDMLSLINSEITDHEDECEESRDDELSVLVSRRVRGE